MMTEKQLLGVYRKFIIKRTDGKHRKGKKHENCRYFVLDLDHDPFAIPALRAYAKACRKEFPTLAYDLNQIQQPRGPSQ